MPQFTKYFPLVKVDEVAHTITGLATAEIPDKDGEICDYEYAKAHSFPDWSNEAAQSTKAAGQDISYGNIRLQHSLEMAGKVSAPPSFDDAEKAVYLTTEPISETIWTKAKQGYLRGFSIGGGYAWRKCNDCKADIPQGNQCSKCKTAVLIRYGACISETSYVDNPALKAATFSLVKADGSTEIKKFEGNPGMEPKQETAGIADPVTTSVDVEALTAQITKSVMEQLGKTVKYLITDKDGNTHLPYTKANGDPDHRLMGKAWAALHGVSRGNKYEGEGEEKAITKLKAVYTSEGLETPSEKATKAVTALFEKDAEGRELPKSFTGIVEDLSYLKMATDDGTIGDSTMPEELKKHFESLAKAITAMGQQEELTAAAVKKGAGTMNNENALAKAHKSVVEQLGTMKKALSDHATAMLGHVDSIHKTVSGDFDVQGSGPDPIDPQVQGTPNTLKAVEAVVQKTADQPVEPTFTKAEVEALVKKTAEDTVLAMVKALAADDDSAPVSKAAFGIGDRSQMGNGAGPVIRTMPVTKTQDGANGQAAPVAEEVTPADVTRGLSGDVSAALKFMKGVQSTDQVPVTVGSAFKR
jgi:hypothetical protein